MKRPVKGKNTGRILAALLLVLLLCGCAPIESAAPKYSPVITEMSGDVVEVKPTLKRDYPSGSMEALEIERDTHEYADGYILYPKVTSGTRADKINAEMCKLVRERAEGLKTQVFTEYRVETNAAGLYSVLFSLLELNTNELLDVFPLTFDTASGEVCSIAYYFEPNSEAWREELSELAEKDAAEKGMHLLNTIAPVKDEQDYYIAGDKLVLQYHLYEIAVFADGMPKLEIPLSELTPYLAKNSPLLRAGLTGGQNDAM